MKESGEKEDGMQFNMKKDVGRNKEMGWGILRHS